MTLVVPDQSFDIQIKMTSDWHIGSGAGRGEIDSLVQLDQDGLPYIPAKTLTGILRDGCEQIALALDSDQQAKPWHRWVDFLFGEQPSLAQESVDSKPHPAVLGIRSAYLPEDLRQVLSPKSLERLLTWTEQQGDSSKDSRQQIAYQLQMKRQLKAAIAFIKPGVAIDGKTGSAQPKCLRFEEVVRMGAVLTAPGCTLDLSEAAHNDDHRKIAYALLVAGAKLVERLGGKRRRGNGTCTITIDSQSEEWIRWLEQNYNKVKVPPGNVQESKLSPKPISSPAADTIWYRIPLTVTAQTPIVLPKRTVGNVVESLDYIPGRYFLRHLHRVLGHQLDVSTAIAQGDLVMTNATIAINNQPGRPTPLCLFSEKLGGGLDEGKGVYNRFQDPAPIDGQGREIQTKGERRGYLRQWQESHLPDWTTVPLDLFTHNTIKDAVQRPTSDVGGVYSYQAIPAGTILMAELRLPQSWLVSQQKDWWQQLGGKLHIGQSKKDQYGVINLEPAEPEEILPATQLDKLYVWLLSDVLLRNQHLGFTSDPQDLRQALEAELEVKLKEPADSDHLLSLMLRQRRTESWQVRWGLPRPSMLGWQAGSCVVYQVEGTLNSSRLAALEARGIGDRRAEGYGQLCFNDPLLTTPLKGKKKLEAMPERQPVTAPLIAPGSESFAYARTIETAAWRSVIAKRALEIAVDATNRKQLLGIQILKGEGNESESLPPMSQLGGLRSAIRGLTQFGTTNSVTEWLDAVQAVENRKNKWPAGSLDTIRNLVTDPDLVWERLGDLRDLTITQTGSTELKVNLWAEAVRTLVDPTIRAHKRDLEKKTNHGQEVA
jgi:CRISPR-associated protein Csx10